MKLLSAAAAAALFVILATANSAGYRYGASDQAFYIPAVAMSADATLFPHDRTLFEPQMRLWWGDSILGRLVSVGTLPTVFAVMYLTTLAVFFAGAVALGRSLGASWPVVAAFLALLTLKHQIMRTGANSLEGYAHPRMLAFAIGIAALTAAVRQRSIAALALVGVALVVHPTTAVWFGIVLLVAIASTTTRRSAVLWMAGAGTLATIVFMFTALRARLVTMDSEWIAAIGDRSYLFSADWPIVAWLVNLGYAIAIGAIYRRRAAVGAAVTGERGLVAGLLALLAIFFMSVPLTALHIALAVQLQVNRIFWLLDFAATFYVGWWIVGELARRARPRARWAIVAAIVAASTARGLYLLNVAPARAAVEVDLAPSHWTDAMRWLRDHPDRWHVLADPQHAVRFGSSVRVAALRDTFFEAGKDPALAIYDREAAQRVLERSHAVAGFDAFATADVRALGTRYNLDVFVDRASRGFDLPVLYRNDGFIVYDLR